jgi:superfamily I DNA and/or RNA helicase
LRIVGDADINKARVFGLRRSSQMRRELKTEGSALRDAFIAELPEFSDKESLIQSILILGAGEINRQAINATDVPEPKVPKSDAPLEDMEKYQEEVDAYSEKYQKELEKNTRKIEKQEYKRLEKKEIDELYKIYEGYVIDRLCSVEMADKYYEMCIYLGTYKDPEYKKLAFESFEQFENSPKELKNELLNAYRNLELGMDDLKKLRGVTGLIQPGQ